MWQSKEVSCWISEHLFRTEDGMVGRIRELKFRSGSVFKAYQILDARDHFLGVADDLCEAKKKVLRALLFCS